MSVTSFTPKIAQLITSENGPFVFLDKKDESLLLQTYSKIGILDLKNNKLLNIDVTTALTEKEAKIESLKNQTLSFACLNSNSSFITMSQAGTLAWWESKDGKISCLSSKQTLSKTVDIIHKTFINDKYLFIRKGLSTDTTSLIDVYDRLKGNKITEIPADLKHIDEALNNSGIFQTKIKHYKTSEGDTETYPSIEQYQFNDTQNIFTQVQEAALKNTHSHTIRTICAINETWLVLARWRQGTIKVQEIDHRIIKASDLSEHSTIKEPTSYREILCDNHLVMWSTKSNEGINIWNISNNKKEASIPWEKLIQKSTDTTIALLHAEISNKNAKIIYQENSTLKTAEFPLEILSTASKNVKEPEKVPTKKFSFLSLFKK